MRATDSATQRHKASRRLLSSCPLQCSQQARCCPDLRDVADCAPLQLLLLLGSESSEASLRGFNCCKLLRLILISGSNTRKCETQKLSLILELRTEERVYPKTSQNRRCYVTTETWILIWRSAARAKTRADWLSTTLNSIKKTAKVRSSMC